MGVVCWLGCLVMRGAEVIVIFTVILDDDDDDDNASL